MSQPVALYLQDAHTIAEGREFVRYAEAKGFDAVWQAESRLVRDAVVPMAAFATVTDTIKVGSGVADCWSRNPARLAATFASLDDLAPGRIILGFFGAVGEQTLENFIRRHAKLSEQLRGARQYVAA